MAELFPCRRSPYTRSRLGSRINRRIFFTSSARSVKNSPVTCSPTRNGIGMGRRQIRESGYC